MPRARALLARRAHAAGAVVGAALLVMGAIRWQQPRQVTLAAADRTLDGAFSNIRGVRELSDGRVLVSDLGDNRLVVADLERNDVRAIGRTGAGPGEVRHFGRLYELGGDSTLLTDEPDGRRWLVLSNDSIVHTVPPDDPLLAASSGAPRGTDRRGNIVTSRTFRQVRTNQRNGFRLVDSALALIIDRRSLRTDTIGRLLDVDQRVQAVGSRASPSYIFRQAHLSSVESVSIAPDGWVAVATHAPCRVTWRRPDGRTEVGPELDWPEIRVDARERRAHAERVERLSGYPLGASEDENWALRIPPFGGSFAALHTPDGHLLLRKVPRAGAEGTRYDIIDRTGRIVAWMLLPERSWLVGFGARFAYVVSREEDGLQRLSRHRWTPLQASPRSSAD